MRITQNKSLIIFIALVACPITANDFDMIPIPIESVQTNLKRLGYDNVDATGKLDENTKEALNTMRYLTSDSSSISQSNSDKIIISKKLNNNLKNISSLESFVATKCLPVAPEYPRKALIGGINGEVTVGFDLSTDGKIRNVSILKSTPRVLFDRATLSAINKMSCVKPESYIRGMRYTYTFSLE